jgi:hypothetical protein
LAFLFLDQVVDEPPAPLPAPFKATFVGDAPAPLAKTTPDAPSDRARDRETTLTAFKNLDFIEKLLRFLLWGNVNFLVELTANFDC